MKGAIWYKDKWRGTEKLNELVSKYEKMNIQTEKRISDRTVLFQNGDLWEILPCIPAARGKAFNISLIQREIDKNFVQKIIFPCTKASPFTAYNYY